MEQLKTKVQSAGKRSDSYEKRTHNIKWIRELPRKTLRFGKKERQILISTPLPGEKMYIQYPGKESIRTGEKTNLYDFRPKLFYEKDGKYHDDISFDDIWRDLETNVSSVKQVANILSTLLYRLAFMSDHIINSQKMVEVRHLDKDIVKSTTKEALKNWYSYSPPPEVFDKISSKLPQLCNMNILSFFHYLDLLGWNEDCKYWDRKYVKAGKKIAKMKWLNKTGRINTILTIINFIGLISGNIQQSKPFSKLARFGIAAATNDDILKVCCGYISK